MREMVDLVENSGGFKAPPLSFWTKPERTFMSRAARRCAQLTKRLSENIQKC